MTIKRESGVTLLEIILVLVIGTMIIVLSIRQYGIYRYDAEIAQIKYNVNDIFRALGLYYQANCRIIRDSNGTVVSGTLDPTPGTFPNNPFPVDIANLSNDGYISPWPPVTTSNIVESYVAQFNEAESSRYIYQCYKNPLTGTVSCSAPQSTVSAGMANNVILWRAQVAIKLRDPAQAAAMLNVLGANCISEASGTTVLPCSSSPNSGGYLVWEQLPSSGTSGQISELWPSTPRLKQVNQQYTNDDLYEFNKMTWPTPPIPTYYLCGG